MIVPFPSELSTPSRNDLQVPKSSKFRKQTAEWGKKLSRCWSALYISYRGGQYSIERLLALEEYTRNTPLLRAVWICVAAPIPAIAFTLLQELLPLQDPADGWAANYTFWIRVFIVAAVIAINFIVHAQYMVSGCVVSTRQFIMLVLGVATFETAMAIAVAAYTWFPVPFGMLTMAPPFYPLLIVLFYAVVGLPVIREMLNHSDELLQYMNYSSAQQLMAIVYPAYQVLFLAATNTKYELLVILLLPVMKLVVKNIFMRCVTHMEDSMPEAVIFSIDFFNALYVSTSMQSASSSLIVATIVLFGMIQFVSVVYRLRQRSSTLLTRIHIATGLRGDGSNLLSSARSLCEEMNQFERQNRCNVRIRSCLTLGISPEDYDVLNRLEVVPCPPVSDDVSRHTTPILKKFVSSKSVRLEGCKISSKVSTCPELQKQTAIVPTGTPIFLANADVSEQQADGAKGERYDAEILRETLEVMFTTECLTLCAYLDAAVPLMYGNFLLAMVHLPNAKYHAELVGVTPENVGSKVSSIFIYFSIEIVLLGVLALLIYRNLGMLSVYQLAFVLETQWKQIQAKLFGWALMTMAFRLVHFGRVCMDKYLSDQTLMSTFVWAGVDFTFKFAWLKHV